MNRATLLVDPIAALFRTELSGSPPLVLDETSIEVQLVAPLARVLTARRFTNSSDQWVEAVLTLPPIAPDEILYGLEVWLDGVVYHALPQAPQAARRAQDVAVAAGRRAILYEVLEHGVPMISIAGIKPGSRVEILSWSIRPLARPEVNRATLLIPLCATANEELARICDADAVVTTRERHAATLTVSSEALQVSILGQPDQDQQLRSNEPIGVECSTPILLEVIPLEGGSLDHSEWQVDKPGGWEATSQRGIETFRHPSNPGGRVTSNRTDWIFGVIATSSGEIRVTAPLQGDCIAPSPHGLRGLAPIATGMRAFAAVGFVESATRQEPDAVRIAANILSRANSLAFVGPDSESTGEAPLFRKLALPEPSFHDVPGVPEPPVAEPPPTLAVEPRNAPVLPDKGEHIAPGRKRSPRHWLTWVPILLLVGVFGASFMSIHVPFLPFICIFTGLMVMSAWRFVPSEGAPVRRRLPLLTVLPLPWIASLLGGPLVWQKITGEVPDIADWMIPFQFGTLAAAVLLPCLLIAWMPGARRFALVLGLLNLVLTFFLTAASVVTLTPGT